MKGCLTSKLTWRRCQCATSGVVLHAVRLPVIRIAAHSHDFGWSQEVNSFRNSESLFSVESEWMVCSHHIAGLNLTARVAVM